MVNSDRIKEATSFHPIVDTASAVNEAREILKGIAGGVTSPEAFAAAMKALMNEY